MNVQAPTLDYESNFLNVFQRAAQRGKDLAALRVAVARGITGENELTNMVFRARHPELRGRRLRSEDVELVREWRAIRADLVRPALRSQGPRPAAPPQPAQAPRTSSANRIRSTRWLREVWSEYRCAEARMTWMRIYGRNTPVNPLTRDAWTRLEQVLRASGFQASSAWNYNCREIKGRPGQASLHAYGLAVDFDPSCNPHRKGVSHAARFSNAATQAERCVDVKAKRADTTLTPAQVAAAEAIRTVDGLQVFAWGGRWKGSPDAMHFQINVSPAELRRGLAPS